MYIDFDKLPDYARVWVYQANRALAPDDVNTIKDALQTALEQWAAHGQPLLASMTILNDRFVVIGVDEGYNLPSGCSIDASVRIIQAVGRQLAIDFFDRSAAIYLADGTVSTVALPMLKTAVAEGLITPGSTVVNTLITKKAEFLTDWHVPAINSWMKRYFNSVPV